MQRHLYPDDWEQRVRAANLRAGGRCEGCGAVLGTLRISRKHNLYFLPLHTCHINHDPHNPQAEIQKLCPRCHGQTHHWMRGKRTHAHKYGYQTLTVAQLVEAARSGGVEFTPAEAGYYWQVDDLAGEANDLLAALSQALHFLRMERLEHRHMEGHLHG